MENLYHPGPNIRTISGKYINVLEPQPEQIDIYDIAYALSHQCRFAGHMHHFFTVAQHSIEVANITSIPNRLAALLHDASEAYLVDVPRPVKQQLPDYKLIEDNLMAAIALKFGFEYPFHPEIKENDDYLLGREWRELVTLEIPNQFTMFTPKVVREVFLHQFKLLSR